MSVHYLLDGYNLIETHSGDFPGKLRTARDRLIDLIIEKRPEGSGRNMITLFFDGQPGIDSPREKRLDVRFTSGKEADWHIKKFVDNSDNPRRLIVVTNDKAIIKYVSIKGAKTMSSDDFLSRLFTEKRPAGYRTVSGKNLTSEEMEDINRDFLKKKGLLREK
ncbi:MAG: NYN domain-containing protein [Elusimicrobiota bacterium]